VVGLLRNCNLQAPRSNVTGRVAGDVRICNKISALRLEIKARDSGSARFLPFFGPVVACASTTGGTHGWLRCCDSPLPPFLLATVTNRKSTGRAAFYCQSEYYRKPLSRNPERSWPNFRFFLFDWTPTQKCPCAGSVISCNGRYLETPPPAFFRTPRVLAIVLSLICYTFESRNRVRRGSNFRGSQRKHFLEKSTTRNYRLSSSINRSYLSNTRHCSRRRVRRLSV
jgi:hypothetical protein